VQTGWKDRTKRGSSHRQITQNKGGGIVHHDIETRGPRGPWVAHLRKRSKVTVEPIIENPRGII